MMICYFSSQTKSWLLGRILLLVIFLFLSLSIEAQVTIGSGEPPHKDALLDLKENAKGTSMKGILLPRVELEDLTKPAPLTQHVKGMFVYNTLDKDDDIFEGCYYNDGEKWMRVGNGTQGAEEDLSDLWTAQNGWKIVSQRTLFYGKIATFFVELQREGEAVSIWGGSALQVAGISPENAKYSPFAFMNCLAGFPSSITASAAEAQLTKDGLYICNLRKSVGTFLNRSAINKNEVIVLSGSYFIQ